MACPRNPSLPHQLQHPSTRITGIPLIHPGLFFDDDGGSSMFSPVMSLPTTPTGTIIRTPCAYHIEGRAHAFGDYSRVAHDANIGGGIELFDSSSRNRRLIQVKARRSIIRTVTEKQDSLTRNGTKGNRRKKRKRI